MNLRKDHYCTGTCIQESEKQIERASDAARGPPDKAICRRLVLRKAWPTSSTLPECLFSEDAAASSLIGGNRKLRNVRTRALLVSGVRTIRLAQTPTGQQGRTRAGHIRPLWFDIAKWRVVTLRRQWWRPSVEERGRKCFSSVAVTRTQTQTLGRGSLGSWIDEDRS